MNRRAAAPAELFAPTPQPRYVEAERLEVYLAVLHLRRLGFVVLRHGRGRHAIYRRSWGLHLVKTLDDRRLVIAAVLCQ